ncbi:MAG: AAA family ATPase, partial [Paludibacteraceae bacterium]|nr:AAA family ATPase [Paludibacteraceae bacterium]
MLKQLSIDNYALIGPTCIDFSKGFSVITGETGAGKSIMLGALGLLLGQRADVSVLRNPEAKCITEAVFDIKAYNLQPFFATNDLDYDDECVIRREIAPNGKSRAFINDTPVVLTVLKELGDHLLDIHSQHQNLLLSNAGFQLKVVDVVASNDELLKQYKAKYVTYRQGLVQLKKLTDAASKGASDLEFVQFQFNQLQEANLKAGEQEELEAEQSTLSNAESIKEGLSRATWLISEGDSGNVLSNLKDAVSALTAVVEAYPQVKSEIDRLNSSLIELKDVARELDADQNSVEASPERLAEVDERLSLLYSLEQKHKVE